MANEFGDYQTPTSLAQRVINVVNLDSTNYTHLVEPTFGDGNFISVSLDMMPSISSVSGFELQTDHFETAKARIKADTNVALNLRQEDIFAGNIHSLFAEGESNLVIGNLPWVTVSQLSTFESKNIPKKANIKGLTGFDALTGKSNFDIAEYISLLLMHELSNLEKPSTLAVLVKNIVAQNIMRYLPHSNLSPSSFSVYEFDAKKEFNVSADAGLMVIKFDGRHGQRKFNNVASVYDLSKPRTVKSSFGWVNDKFVSDVATYRAVSHIDHNANWDWRSGIKHDAGKIMELASHGSQWINGLGEHVNLESALLFPLVKSSDIRKQNIHTSFRKFLLVSQTSMGQDSSYIQRAFPLTWKYLNSHLAYFSKRKSSIYKNKDQFAIFGVGSYSFAPYKVAVSGMYKTPTFAILPPKNGKPVVGDDTVYFIGFDNMSDATICAAILNSNVVQSLLSSLVFISSKRPYTKDILKRIDIVAALNSLSFEELQSFSYAPITETEVQNFTQKYSRVDTLF